MQFVHRLKERARYCEFERHGTGEMTTEDELIMLRFIEGMHDSAFKYKLLETLQSIDLTVETCIEFVQQLELIIKKSITNNRTPEKRAAQLRNSMQKLWRTACPVKMSAQPSIRHALFAKEKITPRRCADTKKC